jgi:hypothetical protein
MQELHDDFGTYPPNPNTRFNSTIIDDDDNIEDCHMEDDEICQTHNPSSINEKCLLDELLQTEEVK